MRFMRRVSVIKLREEADSMLAYILIEPFSQIFCSSVECRSHHLEAEVDVRREQCRESASLVICEVTVDL